jgi:hypothetical protein
MLIIDFSYWLLDAGYGGCSMFKVPHAKVAKDAKGRSGMEARIEIGALCFQKSHRVGRYWTLTR